MNVKGSADSSLSSKFQSLIEHKKEETVTIEDTTDFKIGPDSRAALYQLVFSGGGISMSLTTTATEPKPLPNVTISCHVKQPLFLKDIDIVFTKQSVERPKNLIIESSGGNSDINGGFGGDYSWLVPVWTTSMVSWRELWSFSEH